jgi:short-chain fatty acids transporter
VTTTNVTLPEVRAEIGREAFVARVAAAATVWSERFIPDAFVFALVATVVVVVAGATIAPLGTVIDAWGTGVWDLLAFTLQMALIIVGGHALASAPQVRRVIQAMAAWPRGPRQAVALVTAFALVTAWFNWGFSLIFSAVLAREVARRVDDVDYRALGAATFLGLGSIWAQGLSGSASLQMATPGALQPALRAIVATGGTVPGGIIGLAHTVFLWQSVVAVAVEIAIVTAVMWMAVPSRAKARTAAMLGVELTRVTSIPRAEPTAATPGASLEHSPVLMWLVAALGVAYLYRYFAAAAEPLNAITLNIVNLTMLIVASLLHRTPARLMEAVREATPAVWAVILQFPFYAGIASVITVTHLNERLAHMFTAVSSHVTLPAVVAFYSGVLGIFVPSGGSKWIIEAPYVMAAAHAHQVHLGWIVNSYNLGEAAANLVQPFWMLPTLGLLGLRARDVMGYTFIVFVVLFPTILALVTILGLTLPYPL